MQYKVKRNCAIAHENVEYGAGAIVDLPDEIAEFHKANIQPFEEKAKAEPELELKAEPEPELKAEVKAPAKPNDHRKS